MMYTAKARKFGGILAMVISPNVNGPKWRPNYSMVEVDLWHFPFQIPWQASFANNQVKKSQLGCNELGCLKSLK